MEKGKRTNRRRLRTSATYRPRTAVGNPEQH